MNTQGWIRGLIAHNSPMNKFFTFVSNTIANEFGFSFDIFEQTNDFILYLDDYKIIISNEKITALQKIGPYALDKYILDTLKEKGFAFDFHRSQYIEYCYGLLEII